MPKLHTIVLTLALALGFLPRPHHAQPPGVDEARILTGHIETGLTPNGEVLVALDREGDQVADDAFIVALDQGERLAGLSISDGRVTLRHRTPGFLPILSQEKDGRAAWLLAIDEEDHRAAREHQKRLETEGFVRVEILSAQGISYYWGLGETAEAEKVSWRGLALVASLLEAVVVPGETDKLFHQYPGGHDDAGRDCDAGGPGASSCSVQGCPGQPSGCSLGSCSTNRWPCCRCGSQGAQCYCAF